MCVAYPQKTCRSQEIRPRETYSEALIVIHFVTITIHNCDIMNNEQLIGPNCKGNQLPIHRGGMVGVTNSTTTTGTSIMNFQLSSQTTTDNHE